MASTVQICNQALSKVGAARIIDLLDDTKNARILNAIFEVKRDAELAAHPWTFAIKRAEIPALSTAPAFGWLYSYSVEFGGDKVSIAETGSTTAAADVEVRVTYDATNNSKQATLKALMLLTAGAPAPTVLVVQPASVNDDASPDVRTREDQLSTALDVLATAKQYGIPYVVWAPLMPYNTLNSAQDTIRKGTNTLMQSLAASNGVFWLDFSALGDGADPEKWVTGYNDGTGAAGDGIHPDAGAFEAVMAPALVSVLRKLV